MIEKLQNVKWVRYLGHDGKLWDPNSDSYRGGTCRNMELSWVGQGQDNSTLIFQTGVYIFWIISFEVFPPIIPNSLIINSPEKQTKKVLNYCMKKKFE